MIKQFFAAVTFVLVSGLLFISCKKEKQNVVPSKTEYLTGNWRVTHFAYDENMNKKIDEWEKESAGFEDELSIIFNADGTGHSRWYYYYDSTEETEDFTWKLENGDENIRLIFYYEYGNDTTDLKIYELNTSICILENNDTYEYGSGETEWVIMQKQ